MTPAQFRDIFPEFRSAALTDAMIQTRIDWATARTPVDVWGDDTSATDTTPALREQGIAWLTAHFLCLLPGAKDMRKGEKPGESMYMRERQRLAAVVSGGFRVAGLDT